MRAVSSNWHAVSKMDFIEERLEGRILCLQSPIQRAAMHKQGISLDRLSIGLKEQRMFR
jgi:hypothetical protein